MKLPGELSIFPPFSAEKFAQLKSLKPQTDIKLTNEKPAIQHGWILEGDLTKRAMSITQAENLDKALPPLGEGPEIVLSIVIDASGDVKQISVKVGKEHLAVSNFVEAVKKQLKFDPVPGNSSTSGELKIRK